MRRRKTTAKDPPATLDLITRAALEAVAAVMDAVEVVVKVVVDAEDQAAGVAHGDGAGDMVDHLITEDPGEVLMEEKITALVSIVTAGQVTTTAGQAIITAAHEALVAVEAGAGVDVVVAIPSPLRSTHLPSLPISGNNSRTSPLPITRPPPTTPPTQTSLTQRLPTSSTSHSQARRKRTSV